MVRMFGGEVVAALKDEYFRNIIIGKQIFLQIGTPLP